MKMPLDNTLITFRILLPICTFYYVSFYSLIYRNKIPWHNQKVRVHFLFSHWESKLLWHGFLLYIFLWSVVGLVYATISSHPDWAPNTSDGWPPAVESTSTTLPEKKRWPTLSTMKNEQRERKSMLVVFLMGNEKPQLYRPQKRGYFQILALDIFPTVLYFAYPHTCRLHLELNDVVHLLIRSYHDFDGATIELLESCQWNYYEHLQK